LKTAATANDRLSLLPGTPSWTFDFTQQPNSHFSPGGVINANAATFPAVTGNGITMAIVNLGPCSQLPPHFHARASNYVVSIHGDIQTYMIGENGSPTVGTLLKPGQMTIFPQGAPHTMWNTGCENAQLVSALSNEDAGTMNLANALFQFGDEDEELVNAALGYQDVVNGASKGRVPPSGSGANYGPKSCLAKC
ncbi:RmlC-like cupin domain-containing protein, partial [Elsinoe ampelina]